MINIITEVGDQNEVLDQHFTGRQAMLWTAIPGIVQSFNAEALTCEVQPAIQGKVRQEDGSIQLVNLPLLLDCPVVFPHAGGVSLTFPIKPGDECLVVFSCRAIDLWWQSGGVQPPAETRMHDLSDGFVIPGPYSQVKKISGVSTEVAELRSDDGAARLSLHPETHDVTLVTPGNVEATIEGNLTAQVGGNASATVSGSLSATAGGATTLKCPSLLIDCPATHITGTLQVDGKITGSDGLAVSGGGGATVSGDVVADGISLKSHVHGGVQGGGSDTGGPK